MSESPNAAFDLSQLPPIDKADLQAVHSFLPGKLLGRAAALLSLVLLVLAWAGVVNVALDNFFQLGRQLPWLRNGLLFGLRCSSSPANWPSNGRPPATNTGHGNWH